MDHSRSTHRQYVLAALDKYEQILTRYAARMLCGDLNLAADAVQHTFMKLCEIEQPKPDSHLKAWLFTVCRNRIVDELRKNSRISSFDPVKLESDQPAMTSSRSDRGTGELRSLEDREYIELLKRQIFKLPDRDREMVDLWASGLDHGQIAEVTSQKRGAVRVQLHRAIKTLKEQMAPHIARINS